MSARAVHSPPDPKQGKTITLDPSVSSVDDVMNALPDADELASGTLVLVPGSDGERRSFVRTVLGAFGARTKTIPLSWRCSALVARGYVNVAAHEDMAWGYAP